MMRSSRFGARRWTEARGSISARGLVPFLDTLFNLLFALLAISAAQAPAAFDLLRLRLPSVEPGQTEDSTGARGLVIVLDADGSVRVPGSNEALHNREELDRTLAALIGDALPEEIPIEIQADARCPQGLVVELLQHLRLVGLGDVRLQAIAREGGGGLFGEQR